MRGKKRITAILFAVAATILTAGNPNTVQTVLADSELTDAPVVGSLTCESKMDLQFAKCFDVYYYEDDYKLVDVHDSAKYLLVPEGKDAPDGLDSDITVIQKPLTNIYLAASASMSLFNAIDSLDVIGLSALDTDSWYVEAAKQAMEDGDILYAGKYSEPDYELLISEGCDLAIESTMILHSPKVKEMLEMMGIPVFVDYSSYEEHPLGRTEWVKLYGAMVDKEKEAEEFFDGQAQVVSDLKDFQNTEKTIAFFYVSSDGTVVVRKSTDYVPQMLEIAGGRYIFSDLGADDESKQSSVSMTMEEFYAGAIDADYLIYNATIEDPVETLDDLFVKSDLFRDFKAVKEGNVWCAGKYLYQATDIVGSLITDVNLMLTGGDESQMTFLTKIE